MSDEECWEYGNDGNCLHRNTCECWCHKEDEDES